MPPAIPIICGLLPDSLKSQYLVTQKKKINEFLFRFCSLSCNRTRIKTQKLKQFYCWKNLKKNLKSGAIQNWSRLRLINLMILWTPAKQHQAWSLTLRYISIRKSSLKSYLYTWILFDKIYTEHCSNCTDYRIILSCVGLPTRHHKLSLLTRMPSCKDNLDAERKIVKSVYWCVYC